MAKAFEAEFLALSAVLSGVKDIRDAVARAENVLQPIRARDHPVCRRGHRFKQRRQDAFLPFVERGLVTFIGATTRKSVLEVNGALLSRAAVYVLKPIGEDDLAVLFSRAVQKVYAGLAFSKTAQEISSGRPMAMARRLLNMLEAFGQCGRFEEYLRGGRCVRAGTRWRRTCAASTRAETRSTTRSRRCTNRCAAPRRMRRFTGSRACSTAAQTRCISDAGWCAWLSRTSGSPIRGRCGWRWMRARPTSGWAPRKAKLTLAEAAIYLACAPKSNGA